MTGRTLRGGTRLQLLKQYCRNKTVLDIGCYGDRTSYGHPQWLHGHLCDVADAVTGIDIVEDGIRELQQDGYDVHHADAEQFDLDQTFDTVVAAEVIEHLSNPGLFLDQAAEHLREGGELIITTPNVHSLLLTGAYLYPFYKEEEHTVGFTPELLDNLLQRHGWTVTRLDRVPHEDIPGRCHWVNKVIPEPLQFTMFCTAERRDTR